MTLVERASSCIVGWAVETQCDEIHWQALLDTAPQAEVYHSDGSPTYAALVYTPAVHVPHLDKSQTYRVEGDNAELRHYLARLARRSRCFSRCILALRCALKLFVFAWNRRQLHRHRYPDYTAHVAHFLYP